MKRRSLGSMLACSSALLGTGLGLPKWARAGVSADKAGLLKTTLTPMGGERAGNADGSIPAWTGGLTEVPAGWTNAQPFPDIYANEKPVLTISAANADQYKDKLATGVQLMMQKYGYTINVYPTHRTGCAPQWVYDNIFQNAQTAQLSPRGGRLGFTNAYGGVPFPIPDDDPSIAGVQIIWNHLTRWFGEHFIYDASFISVANGQVTLLDEVKYELSFPYYQKDGSWQNWSGYGSLNYLYGVAPSNQVGAETIIWNPYTSVIKQEQAWEYLTGQGRVRKIPEIQYDIPEAEDNGITVYDEAQGFYGSPDRFDWKLVGKKEIYVPYNCIGTNSLVTSDYGPHFLNPEKVRYELHRVWVIEATLHSGDRNVIPHRVMYIDEDTWNVLITDEYDASGNYLTLNFGLVQPIPEILGTIMLTDLQYNLQQNSYVHQLCYNPSMSLSQRTRDFLTAPDPSIFNPQTMSARAQF